MRLKNLMITSFIVSGLVVLCIVWVSIQKMYVTTETGYILILITCIANVVGAIFGLFLLRGTFHSLDNFREQTRQVQNNCFQMITLNKAPKEFMRLAGDFNDMVVALSDSFTALEKSEQEKSNMISQLGHDIKTPITAIGSQIEAIQDGIILKEEIPEILNQMMNQVERLHELTKQLMEVAMVENENHFLSCKQMLHEVWMDQLLVKILSGFQFKMKKNRQHLCVEMKEDICFQAMDEMSLTRILSNLIDNSIQYANKESTIVITVKKIVNTVEFSIQDEGIGIPKEDIPYIFDRLYRVEKSRNQYTGGSGLGLYISKTLALQLKGTLFVESEEHVGSKFTLVLPC
ncbi:sensor histidine kinase [Amedibacillus sp. YH-ame10]